MTFSKYIIPCMILVLVNFSSPASAQSQKISHHIDSPIMQEDRQIIVYLPAGYENTDKKFPVLYITDGAIQSFHTAGTIDYLSKFDLMPEMIVVGLVNTNRNRDLTLSQSHPTKGANRTLSFLEKEAIPFIKKTYRTADFQMLAGTSHGGQFAVNAFINRPGLFQVVMAVSPSLYWNKSTLLTQAEKALNDNKVKGTLYISIANEEKTMTAPYERFISLFENHSNKTVKLLHRKFLDETHNTTVLASQYYGFKSIFSNWAIPESPQNLASLTAIFKNRSDLLKQRITIPEDRANGYGQWLQYLGRKKEALELFRWNMKQYPQSANTHIALASAYQHFKMPLEAAEIARKALKSLPSIDAQAAERLKKFTPPN